jgi:leucyl/phenylalanyl-tRNA---protein transferase
VTIDLELLLRAYAGGYFPMSDARDDPDVFWVEPERRAILPLDGLRISKSLAKTVRQDRFRVTVDAAFADVIALCAESAEDRDDTWINQDIEEAFVALHRMGHAHSVECWLDERGGPKLVGGLYGLALGRVFFGESMFSRATDASKVALVWLVARMRLGGFELLD